MALAGWVVLFLIGLVVLQMVAYRFFRPKMDPAQLDRPPRPRSAPLAPPSEDGVDELGCRCPACGTVNDRQFVFCRGCVGRLET